MKLLNVLNKLDLTYTQRMGKLMQKSVAILLLGLMTVAYVY